MPHRNEQPTLFELTARGEFEAPRGLPLERSSLRVDPESVPPTQESVSPKGAKCVQSHFAVGKLAGAFGRAA